MTEMQKGKIIDPVELLAKAIYLLDQVAISSRDKWYLAREEGDSYAMHKHKKSKIKMHEIKKKAVMSLLGQGYGSIKGYYKCVEVNDEPHLVAIDIKGYEFLLPISRKISKNLNYLGEQGLVEQDESFEPHISIGEAYTLVSTYLNPNYEEDIAKYKTKNKGKKNLKKGSKTYKKTSEKKVTNQTPEKTQ
jgi:hypothetical protein